MASRPTSLPPRRLPRCSAASFAALCALTACRSESASGSHAASGGAASAIDASTGGEVAVYDCDAGEPIYTEASSTPAPELPPLPPWEPHTDEPSCQHTEVVASCAEGWCRIPAGCFVMGSSEDEPGRGLRDETQVTITLTHDFESQENEATRAEWSQTGWELPVGKGVNEFIETCDVPSCPMTRVNWYAILHYANWLSEQAEPPLSPCYALTDCTGEPEYRLSCEAVEVNAASVYECEGYRLPTEFEWEYAARSGTRTTYFGGPMDPAVGADTGVCAKEPALEGWAWYCNNAPCLQPQPVGLKGANYWGLHDVLGNVWEYVFNPAFTDLTLAPKVDPWGRTEDLIASGAAAWQLRGGSSSVVPSWLRAANRLRQGPTGSDGVGFRLVRTLPPEESP